MVVKLFYYWLIIKIFYYWLFIARLLPLSDRIAPLTRILLSATCCKVIWLRTFYHSKTDLENYLWSGGFSLCLKMFFVSCNYSARVHQDLPLNSCRHVQLVIYGNSAETINPEALQIGSTQFKSISTILTCVK